MSAMSLVLEAAVAGVGLASVWRFVRWRRRLLAQLSSESEIRQTAQGPMEFKIIGTGPVLLHLHAGGSGCDQTLALSWDLHRSGFTVLTPSRPGYLHTPLMAGAAPEQAADAVAGLLDALGMGPVCVLGTSGGGPTALQFALRHPGRVWGLVLQSAISQRFIEPRRSTHSLIGRVVFSRSWDWLVDLGAWCVTGVARYWPRFVVRQLLNASDDLDSTRAAQRLAYVMRRPEEIGFFQRVVASGVPLSVRRVGLHNDLRQFAQMSAYPLEQINCPTLVLHGSADGNVSLAHGEFVVRTIPKAELFTLEDCGHFIWVGPQAGRAREKLRAFLREHAPSPDPRAHSHEGQPPGAEPSAAPNSRQPSQSPASPEVQAPDSRRTPFSGGCG